MKSFQLILEKKRREASNLDQCFPNSNMHASSRPPLLRFQGLIQKAWGT